MCVSRITNLFLPSSYTIFQSGLPDCGVLMKGERTKKRPVTFKKLCDGGASGHVLSPCLFLLLLLLLSMLTFLPPLHSRGYERERKYQKSGLSREGREHFGKIPAFGRRIGRGEMGKGERRICMQWVSGISKKKTKTKSLFSFLLLFSRTRWVRSRAQHYLQTCSMKAE